MYLVIKEVLSGFYGYSTIQNLKTPYHKWSYYSDHREKNINYGKFCEHNTIPVIINLGTIQYCLLIDEKIGFLTAKPTLKRKQVYILRL